MKLCILIVILFTPLLSTAQNDWGNLKGSVTYKTNNGVKHPDAGAEVIIYFIDSIKGADEQYARLRHEDTIVNNSFLAAIYFEEYQTSPIGKTQRQMVRKLKDIDAYPEDRLKELDNTAASIIRARELKQYAKTTADANGNYAIRLRPGYYGIILRSKHLRTRSKAEYNGNITLDNIIIKSGITTIRNEEML